MRALAKKIPFFLWLALAASPTFADELQDCLASAGETSPHAEALARQIQQSLTRDGFLHRAYLSPTELRMHDNRKLAEMLVARLDAECEQPRTPAASEAVDSEIVMMVHDRNLDSIAKLGFQNQHMTGTTGGCNCTYDRFVREQSMIAMQMPFNGKTRDLLPKYSAFNLKSKGYGDFSLPSNYGNIALVMKPEVKKRTTFTFNDSLRRGFESGEDRFPPRTLSYRKPVDGRRLPDCDIYCEAQIWGPLDLGDVAHIMVEKGQEVPESVKKLGIPVYEYENAGIYASGDRTPVDQAAQYKKGKELLKAKPGRSFTPASLSRKEIEEALVKTESSTIKNIFETKLLEKMADSELIEKFKAGPDRDEFDPFSRTQVKTSHKVFGELAARPLTPAIESFLMENRTHGSTIIRHQALIGLSALPREKFRPLLLNAFKDSQNNMRVLAMSMAADFPDDKELQAEVRKLSDPTDPPEGWKPERGDGSFTPSIRTDMRELGKRLAQGTFCAPTAERPRKAIEERSPEMVPEAPAKMKPMADEKSPAKKKKRP